MGTKTVQNILDRSWIILHDTHGTDGVRWPSAEGLLWVSDGQRETVVNLPSAYVKDLKPTLQAGTRQTFAGLSIADGIQPIALNRNFDAAGTVPGNAITPRPKAWLDENRPNWHNDPPGPARIWCFDPNDTKSFYVWPPAPGTLKAELIYSAIPADLTALTDTIVIDDVYANALHYYVLFRSFSKNATYTKNPQLALQYYQLFLQSLGVKDARVKALDANLKMQSDGAGVAGPGA